MINIGSLALNGTPTIAVPFTAAISTTELQAAQQQGLDLAELRLDLCRDQSTTGIDTLISSFASVPTLATIRSAAEGGEWPVENEAERLALYEHVLPHVDAIDIENGAKIREQVVNLAKTHNKPVILSYHNFTHTPPSAELIQTIQQMRTAGADVCKLAVMTQTVADAQQLTQILLEHNQNDCVIIGMGDYGLLTRVFLAGLGSLFTFAHLGAATAPGQIPLPQLHSDLRRYFPADYTTTRA